MWTDAAQTADPGSWSEGDRTTRSDDNPHSVSTISSGINNCQVRRTGHTLCFIGLKKMEDLERAKKLLCI